MMQRTLLTSAVVLLAARSHPSVPLRRVGIQRRSSTISPTTSRYWSETPPRNRDWQDFASCSARTSMFPASAALLSADIGGLSPVTATGVPRAVRELRRGHYSDRLSEFADSGDLLRATGNQAAQDRAIVSSEIIRGAGRSPRGQPINVDWHLTGGNGTYKISDVVIDGLSMAVNGRAELASVVERNGGQARSILAVLRQQTASSARR
jgi:hypothetical protein